MSLDSGPDALLFTYGTLMLTTGIAVVDAATRNAGISLGRAFIHGHLYDLGEYPGAVPLRAGSDPGAGTQGGTDASEDSPKVWGRLIRLRDPASFYAVIDPYEGFLPDDLPASEFVRAETEVFLADGTGTFSGQVYYFNFTTQGRAVIPSGDYLSHWHTQGRPARGRIPR